MLTELAAKDRITHPFAGARLPSGRALAVELVATAGLAISLVIAMTAVSIGIARAETFGAIGEPDGASLALALFLGLLFAGMGGLTALFTYGSAGRN
jgi:hypothetical protein